MTEPEANPQPDTGQSLARPEGSADERDRRLMLAENILSDLATGYWAAVLDDNDNPVKERMGQRILNYWRTWDSPPNGEVRGASRPAGEASASTVVLGGDLTGGEHA